MSKKSKKNRINVVYSTNPNFEYEEEFDEVSSIPFSEQNLYVLVDRKNKIYQTLACYTKNMYVYLPSSKWVHEYIVA